jgi:hypothetical protein
MATDSEEDTKHWVTNLEVLNNNDLILGSNYYSIDINILDTIELGQLFYGGLARCAREQRK